MSFIGTLLGKFLGRFLGDVNSEEIIQKKVRVCSSGELKRSFSSSGTFNKTTSAGMVRSCQDS
jgi:hypothetical protein